MSEHESVTTDRGLGDAHIRPALHSRLLAEFAAQPDTVIIEELGVCRGEVRIDLAVVNGALHGYEIKSDRDSLRRLDGQIDYYSRVLDRATIVAGARHLGHVRDAVPHWWGVLCVSSTAGGLQFKTIRRGRRNPSRNPRSLVELLWVDDAMSLLERHGLARGARGKPRWFVWDRVCESVSTNEIAAEVRKHLKTRAVLVNPQQP